MGLLVRSGLGAESTSAESFRSGKISVTEYNQDEADDDGDLGEVITTEAQQAVHEDQRMLILSNFPELLSTLCAISSNVARSKT